MFPLHDVLEPADHVIDAHGAMMMIGETFLWTVRSRQRSTERLGGAGRDRTDDLKLAKLPLYQLSYGPILRRSGAARLAQTCAARGRACGDFVADTPS